MVKNCKVIFITRIFLTILLTKRLILIYMQTKLIRTIHHIFVVSFLQLFPFYSKILYNE